MKKLNYILWLFICLLLFSSSLAAEDAEKPAMMSLQDCITTAMQNNVDVLTAQNNLSAAKSRSTRAKSGYFPQVSIQNNAFTWGDEGVLNKVSTGTAFSVNQNIFDGGLREANVQSTRYGVSQNEAGIARTLQTVAFNVSKAYYEALRARHLAGVAEANVKYNEGLRDQVQARADVGDAAKVDILPVEAQLASARVSLLSTQNSVRTSIIELQNVMGLSPRTDFSINEIDLTPNSEVGSLDSYIDLALKSRPDVAQSQAGTGAAKASVRSARISMYPRPTVSAEYQNQISGGFTSNSTQMVGGIVFDIFDGGANKAAYAEAKSNLANAQLQEKQITKDIRAQVEEAYLNLLNAKERVTASKISLDWANRNYDVQKDRYTQGLGTTLDLLNAEVQVVTAESDDVQSRYDYYIALAQIEYAVGRQAGR